MEHWAKALLIQTSLSYRYGRACRSLIRRLLWRLLLLSGYALAGISVATVSWAFEPPDHILFGGDANYPPQEWMERNQAQGFNVDLAQELARIGGSRAEFKLGAWPDALTNLEVGTVDVVPMYYSPERAKRFIFTTPFYYSSHSLYGTASAPRISNLAQLQGLRVAVEKSSFAEQQFNASSAKPKLVLTANTLEALRALTEGRADYAVLASLTADTLISEKGFALERIGPPFWSRGYAFAVNRNNPELASWLQAALDESINSGRYQEIYNGWANRLEPSVASERRLRWLSWLSIGLSLVLVLSGIGFWCLKRLVAGRTRDLRQALALQQDSEQKLRHLANYDVETGLCKATFFAQLLDAWIQENPAQNLAQSQLQKQHQRQHQEQHQEQRQEQREPRELLLIKVVDLDMIVRTLGIARAEAIVANLARVLAEVPDAIAGYLGRGVYALFMARVDSPSFLEQTSFKAAARDSGFNLRLVGGSAYWPSHGRSALKLMRHAETALATSEARQKTWLGYELEMEPSGLDLDLISVFVKGNVQGLYPMFQPQLNLHTGRIDSAEVLVRLQHPRLGFLPPKAFIPLLENAGLIEQVTALMIDEAVRVSAQLRRENIACNLAVNVAAQDLSSANLVETISQTLVRYQGRPGDLSLEITESSVAQSPVRVRKVLSRLSELGIFTALDDFGTGQSSLTYLSNFPITELKIDRSFVGDMLTNPRNLSIVRSTLVMARELGLVTIAEGVEDSKTLELLRAEGCDLVQGYVVSHPLNEKDFVSFLRDYHSRGAKDSRRI